MKIKLTVVVVIVASLLFACGSKKESEPPKSCLESIPEAISGLKISGARPEKNVIANLWPTICRARELYAQRMKENPKLGKGMIELKITVDFNGEIEAYSIARSTLDDPAFDQKVLRVFEFMDFDPYGPHNAETQILLPIRFKP
ncbi:hypothetical protein DSCO28_66760 [Desulfosarcina ovata subsp. sediminis]|uniref:Uncharacterized protein n=1 Tax=Desulfosarcina ovata subsp. sediminis TaxID=885957 RepID=A0A5K8A1B4_9BACT|nr:energy transducer TonB [Desulfosarcina ovata]BBO86110.1 hypothetical protein DSCO28_66760 [Desulfosarcina ovata subsp. sediminis]